MPVYNAKLSIVAGLIFGFVILFSGDEVYSQTAPSNKEIYELLIKQQKEIDNLRQRAQTAEKELRQMRNSSQPDTIKHSYGNSSRSNIGASKHEKEAWTTEVKASALMISSDGLLVVMGDSTNNDVKDSDEIAPGVNPGIDLRFTRALPDSRLTFGIGGKFLYSSNDENFVGRDIQPFTR